MTQAEAYLCYWPMIFHGKDVRSIIDERDKSFWVHVGDLGKMLGYANVHDSIKDYNPAWKRDIVISDVTGRQQSQRFIIEAGVYKLCFRSGKPEAEAFTEKVADLLVKLRSGELQLRTRPQALTEHTVIRQQKDNSISYNRKVVMEGGSEEAKKRNGLLCKYVSDKGLSPTAYKLWAKEIGLPYQDRSTGQAVLRCVEPHSAAACSLAKNVIEIGMTWEEAIETARESKSIYRRILKYSMPAELAWRSPQEPVSDEQESVYPVQKSSW